MIVHKIVNGLKTTFIKNTNEYCVVTYTAKGKLARSENYSADNKLQYFRTYEITQNKDIVQIFKPDNNGNFTLEKVIERTAETLAHYLEKTGILTNILENFIMAGNH